MAESGRVLGMTGPFGYIGSQVIKRLAGTDDFERIVCVDIASPEDALPERFEFHHCDIRNGEKLREIFEKAGVDTVLHLAYVVSPTRDSKMERDVDILGAENVIAVSEALSVRKLVVASSDTAYGFFEGTPDYLTEDVPVRGTPGFSYAENKVEVEGLVGDFASRSPDCEVVVFRVCIVMGPSADNTTANSLRQPLIFSVWGYDPIMQLVHEQDAAEAFYLALTTDARGTFNLAADEGLRLSEMAEIMGRPLVPLPAWLSYPLVEILYRVWLLPFGASQLDYIRYPLSMSNEKIRRELGFAPRHTSRQALEAFRGAP